MQSSRGDTGMGQLDCLCEAHGVFYSGFAKWIVLECEESKRSWGVQGLRKAVDKCLEFICSSNEVILGRESQVTFELASSGTVLSFLTWLNTAQHWLTGSFWEFTTALCLTAVGTAFEANVDIMIQQGKRGLPTRSKHRLWTGRPGIKGSCRQVHLNQAESFMLGKFGLGLARGCFPGQSPRSTVLSVLVV